MAAGEPARGEGQHARVTTSRTFPNWIIQQRCSFLLTTYRTGQLCCIGAEPPDGVLAFRQTGFARALGVCAEGPTVWLAAQAVLWRLENALAPGELSERRDRLFEPRLTYITGDVDIRELGVRGDGSPMFVNAKYSCLAAPSATHSFRPLWRPPFISALVPEDRCRLNGLAMEGGEPRYVTALGAGDGAQSWRAGHDGGVLIDVRENRIVAENLSRPNSPRVHGGKVWLLESGRGQLVTVDPASGAKTDIAFLPGYPRGLAFHKHFAAVGVSLPRTDVALPLHETMRERGAQTRCGLFLIDTRNGGIVEWLTIEGAVSEIFGVATLPGAFSPAADGPGTPGLGTRETVEPS